MLISQTCICPISIDIAKIYTILFLMLITCSIRLVDHWLNNSTPSVYEPEMIGKQNKINKTNIDYIIKIVQ